MVLRVYFHDYANASRYSKAQVDGFFGELDTLWRNTSYNKITIAARVSDLFQLPANRSAYIDDFSDGDLSNGGKFSKVLNDSQQQLRRGDGTQIGTEKARLRTD